MKNIILLLCTIIIFGCKKDKKEDSDTYSNMDMTVTVSFTPAETSFIGVANAIVLTGRSTTSGYVDLLVNGQNKGSQAAFDEGNVENGKYVITPTEKVGALTLVLTTTETPASVLIESDLGGKKESKTYAVEPNKMLQLQFK